jgi:hypothetical protein
MADDIEHGKPIELSDHCEYFCELSQISSILQKANSPFQLL